MKPTTLTIDDLRKSVDLDKVMRLLKEFDGEANISALCTLAAALGVLIGGEADSAEQLMAAQTAVSFIIHDAAQAAIRERLPVAAINEPEIDKPTLQ